MNRTPLWLAGVVLLAGCSSPVQQAKDTKYEKLYRDAQDAIEVLENALDEAGAAHVKQASELSQVREELRRRQELYEGEKLEFKATIGRLESELELLRKEKSGANKPEDAQPPGEQ